LSCAFALSVLKNIPERRESNFVAAPKYSVEIIEPSAPKTLSSA